LNNRKPFADVSDYS